MLRFLLPLLLSAGTALGAGHRLTLTNGDVRVPVAVVRGTPHEMGRQLGSLLRAEIAQLAPAVVAGFKQELKVTDEELDLAWASTAGYTDPRLLQQMVGMAEGSGQPVRLLQHVHCLPLLLPYSCSSIAAWGKATEDGHLYQTRNLDWSLRAGAHEFPVLVVYVPSEGHPHVTPSFAGFLGAHCGMNARGIVLSEIGDASARERPYNLHAPHFTSWFRSLLQDADSLKETLDLFGRVPPTKRYHFVFGDGRTDRRAVKIRAATGGGRARPEIDIWRDNDRKDELAPKVLSCVVYHDEGRGAFPTLETQRGKLNGEKLIALANQIPIKGGNVMNAVFDATALRLWVSYAGGGREAYQRPYVHLDLATLDADADGRPDFRAR
ncbi:MAG: hypothetical protein RJA22_525 [Verrucomicrobiota bacterium]|jgi:hypothetical protein